MTPVLRVPAGGHGAGRRRRSPRPFSSGIARPAVFAASGIVIGGLTLGTAFAQWPAASDSSSAVGGAPSIQLIDQARLAPGLAEVRIGFATAGSTADGAYRLLALSPDGTAAAVATQVGPAPTNLTLAHPDGSQQRVAMPGLIGAGFAPDGSWLAAIDGGGAMWHVPASGAGAARVAEGPFIGTPIVEPGGSVLALWVSSIEAPIVSRLVRISSGGTVVALTDDQLVYGAQLMADGTVVYASHQGSRTFVKQTGAGAPPRALADLGEDAVNVAVDPAAEAVAFERGGQVFLRHIAERHPIQLGAGMRPRFAPDGRSILVELAAGTALIALDGSRLASFDGDAGFATCAVVCRP
ncbi:MAG TPA: hypothetical protein VFH98_04900 [Candidatus Limnocylindria bacterium]|nr:hypothetical protein [Candidatus Limnocylindria bacterium]